MKRRGFTLIELMVVVALIAILSTLLIVGVSKLQTNAKRQQTVQLLENCRALWAEYDSNARLHIDPFALSSPGNVTLETEISLEQNNQNLSYNRVGIDVVITRAIFSLMRSQPNIRASMDKFPSGRMFLTNLSTNPNAIGQLFNSQFYTIPNTVAWTPGSGLEFANNSTTPPTNMLFLCIHVAQDANGNYLPQPPPGDTGYWMPMQNEVTDPVLLDAWGNPIIAVVGGQLSGVTAGGRSVTVSSPDKRLFWASAGPDGDFSKGDDNLYSFEKP